jgi:hypothetical protein
VIDEQKQQVEAQYRDDKDTREQLRRRSKTRSAPSRSRGASSAADRPPLGATSVWWRTPCRTPFHAVSDHTDTHWMAAPCPPWNPAVFRARRTGGRRPRSSDRALKPRDRRSQGTGTRPVRRPAWTVRGDVRTAAVGPPARGRSGRSPCRRSLVALGATGERRRHAAGPPDDQGRRARVALGSD